MAASSTVRIDTHAVDTLRYIRASMQAAASLTVPGSSAIAAGTIGLAAALVSTVPTLRSQWLVVWIVAAFIAASIGTFLLLRQSSTQAFTIAGSPARKFALCFVPALLAGAVLTGVHWTAGSLQVIPGTWLLLYGCALVAASAATMPLMAYIGSAFFVVGAIALVAPTDWHMFLLGVGFGGLHIVLGLLLGRSSASTSQDDGLAR